MTSRLCDSTQRPKPHAGRATRPSSSRRRRCACGSARTIRRRGRRSCPRAPPGTYTARLTVDGKRYEQPITLRLDPRVNTPAAGLAQLNTLTRELYDDAAQAHNAYTEARALIVRLGSGADAAALKTKVEAIAPLETGARRGRGFGPGASGGAPRQTLDSVSQAAMAAAMAMQGADIAPTAGQVAAAAKA